MLEEGYSINYISEKFGINFHRLSKLWELYKKHGATVLHRQANIRSNSEFRQTIVLDIENNGYLDKMGDENLLKGSYWTFRVITSIIWASPDDGSSA